MKPQSAKAKGRRLQQFVRDALRALGGVRGLEDGDVESRSMGAAGTDLILSPAAVRVFGPLKIECKNVEKLNVSDVYWSKAKGGGSDSVVLLVHTKNHAPEPLVTMGFNTFMHYLMTSVRCRREDEGK